MFQELVKKAKQGDVDSKREIVMNLQPLLVSSIRKYYNIREEYEDSMQDGNLLILECIETYDYGQGVYFLAYIKSKLMYLYLNKNKIKKHASLNERLEDGEGEVIDLIQSEDMDILERLILSQGNMDLYNAYEKLSEREKQIISLFYIKGDNMKEISEELEISYRTVVNTKTNAIAKLRKYLEK